MPVTPHSISAAAFVLVGGQSRRMGRDKALLELGGKPIFLRTAELLKTYVEEVTLLGPVERYGGFGLPVAEDLYAGQGPLGALYTGLKTSSRDWNLFVACDLPHLHHRVIELLLQRTIGQTAQAIVPMAGGRLQPLCAAYHRDCLPFVQKQLDLGTNRSMAALLSSLRVETLTAGPDENPGAWEKLFTNVNTAEQWEQLQSSVTMERS